MLRNILVILGSIVGFFLALALVAIIGLYFLLRPTKDEVARVLSPDRRATATVTETNGGATTSFGYEVKLFPTHRSLFARAVAFLYGATRSPTAYGVDLHWTSNSELDIEYWAARNANVAIASMTVDGTEVRVVLKPHTLNAAAPQGGTLYNQRKQ